MSSVNAVILAPGTQLEPSNSNVIYNITQNINSSYVNVSDLCVIIDDPQLNDSYCVSSDGLRILNLPEFNTTGIIESIYQSELNITEGDNVTFEVNEEDGVIISWYNWILNGVKIATGKVWNWIVSYDAHEDSPNNISIYVRESDGTTYRTDLYINVEDENLPPEITEFYAEPTLTTFNNNSVTIFCGGSDEEINESELNVEIDYRLGTSSEWIETSPIYNELLGIWTSSFETQPTYNWITIIDIRCRLQDQKSLYSSYMYLYDEIEVEGEQVAPSKPSSITPYSGNFDVVIPIECSGSYDGNRDNFIYIIEADYNGTYKEIGKHFPGSGYEWDISNFEFENTALRCFATDYINESDYIYSSNITITENVNFYVYDKNIKNNMKENEINIFELYCNVENSSNLKINSLYADCNRDNLYDYYFDYENQTTKRKHNKISCIYPESDIYTLSSGCIIERINESISWSSEDVCKSLPNDRNYCQLLREREVRIGE